MKTLVKDEVAQEIKLYARCSRKVIAAAVNAVSGGIGKVSIPILNHVLLEVQEDNMLRMVAGDTILTVEKTIPIVSYEHGAVTVDAKTFSDATSSLPEGDIEIELGAGSKLHARGGKAQFKLFTLPAEEYPRVVIVPDTVHFTVMQREFKTALEQTLFVIDPNHIRPIFQGVLFEIRPEGLQLVTADGPRLSIRTLASAHNSPAEPLDVIISHRGLSLVLKYLAEEDGEVKISISNMHARFDMPKSDEGSFIITTRTIDGQFANWRRILPEGFTKVATLDRLNLLAASKRALYIGKENQFRVNLQFKDGDLTVSSDASVSGSFSDSVDYETPEEFETFIVLNGRHIIQCLESMPTEQVSISMNEPMKPIVVKPVFTESNPAFYDYTHIIMTMQLQ